MSTLHFEMCLNKTKYTFKNSKRLFLLLRRWFRQAFVSGQVKLCLKTEIGAGVGERVDIEKGGGGLLVGVDREGGARGQTTKVEGNLPAR